jgi:mycofactocin glycosyltransferase
MSTTPRLRLDRSVRRRDGGRLLVGGVPPRLLRLSRAGEVALASILAGSPSEPAGTALAARLVERGLLHPVPADDASDPVVTTVIPVRDGGDALVHLLRVLTPEGPVIVVDDGSHDGSAERAAAAGARVIPNAGRPGPAGARNTGLRAATTDLVALLDADCEVEPGWRAGLPGLFEADPRLAVAAPRIRGGGDRAVGRYERLVPPLDLGPAPSLVGPGRRVAFLSSAALIVRRDVLLAHDGFDEEMRFGEDVDLVWRLLAAGWRARHVPEREVLHLPRESLAGFARQRAGYGSSAPDLVDRHGAAAAPLRAGRHPAALWISGSALGPRALMLGLTVSTAIVASRGDGASGRFALAEVAFRGNAEATRHLSRVLVREWLPLSLAAATLNRRARRILVAAFIIDSAALWTGTRRPIELVEATALHALDRAAYSAGMWRAMWRRRDFSALRPRVANPRSGFIAGRG